MASIRTSLHIAAAVAAVTLGSAWLASFQGTPYEAPRRLQWGTMPSRWISGGPNCGTEPQFQIHAYNPDFYILRQSLCTNYEAPFLFLLFGSQKAILFDTGAGGVPVRTTVQGIVDAYVAAHGGTPLQLIVAHLHSHGDHTAGDSQFSGQPNTTVVGTSQSAVANFFGFTQWPTQPVTYDLGGRVLDVLAIPGHHPAHIAVYDRRTGILLTGDSLYPGRLYVNGASSQGNWGVFKASMQRLVDFTNTHPTRWVLGTHIEMTTTPGVDFPLGSTSHPNERVLQLTREHLRELNTALQALPTPTLQVHDDFIIYPIG
ncbi:MAG: MBL fold metallo-hydrolase [Planctomycetes bacterium]|nr:MBL fold metallo-hydrolase [Planctomycetota bacterium]